MNRVTVYTQPHCQPCALTKRHLTKRGIGFDELPLDADVLLRARAAGITSAPVVEAIGHPPFGGYRPDRLDKLVS